MNDTAKKLREAAACIKNYGVASAMAIARVRDALGVGKTDAISRDLGAVLDIIADELDELQARAAGANNLRQRLDSAEKKAERRKKQVERTEDAIRERNARLKMRGETVARLTAENGELRKQVPSEREREILDMWPKFEDGEYVMLGDGFMGCGGVSDVVELLDFEDDNVRLWGESGCDIDLGLKPVIKRPVQSVLDADGVEIKVGDTVWTLDGLEGVVTKVEDGAAYIAYESDYAQCEEAANLTHARPDSWERLEEDAEFNDETGIVGGNLDIVRRAKALAGVEAD